MAKIWTWQEVGDTPDRVLSQAEKQEIADEWTANEIKKEEEQTEEFKQKTDRANANQKLKDLGLTDDEITAFKG